MGWLRKRLKERSTANGLGILTYAASMYFGPGTVDAIVAAVMAVHGAYEAARSERTEVMAVHGEYEAARSERTD